MINFFTLILLALLILLKIILVTAIFNNVSFKEDNKNYKTKILVRDILEAFLLICVIYVLVVKYLEFINVPSNTANTWGSVSAFVTLVLYVLLNLNFLKKYYKETFQCESVSELHRDKIDYLTDSKVFSLVPSHSNSKLLSSRQSPMASPRSRRGRASSDSIVIYQVYNPRYHQTTHG